MKLAVTGKGGVGKTTVCALLARALQKAGRKVFAVDADPDSNLAASLGHPHPESIRPLAEQKGLIEERTGVRPGTMGAVFRLNPPVDDIPEKYAVDIDGVKLLVAGAVKKGGAGCYCPENALLRALVSHLFTDPDCDLVLDMEAGIEHLSRGTVAAVDRLLIVVEPGRRSLETAERIAAMAGQIGLRRLTVVANKVRTDEDRSFLKEALTGWDVSGYLPYDPAVTEADRRGRSVATASPALEKMATGIIAAWENERHDTSC